MHNRVELGKLYEELFPNSDQPLQILNLCQTAHGLITGAYDGPEDVHKIARILSFVLENWEESRNGFDEIVKELVEETLAEIENSSKCQGCGRKTLHALCPAWGTPFYMSGQLFTTELEEEWRERRDAARSQYQGVFLD